MRRLRAPEAWRQSDIARWDACPLSLKLSMQSVEDAGNLAAIGTLAHRWAEQALGYMVEHDESKIPVDMGMELLDKVWAQRDVPDEDTVHVTAEGYEHLRIVVTKFCYAHSYSQERLAYLEKRFTTSIKVRGHGDEVYDRQISGKPDIILAGPGPREATVVDLKFGWLKPSRPKPEPEEGAKPDDKLSSKGIVQQLVYSLLLFDEFPVLDKIYLREFYVMWGESREASYERWQMERIRDIVAGIVANMDAAVEAGAKSKRWVASGGVHCSFCAIPKRCPIRKQARIPTTYEEAQLVVQEWHVAAEIRKDRNRYVHAAINKWGEVELPYSKGRRFVGYKEGSRALSIYEPEDAPRPALDAPVNGDGH